MTSKAFLIAILVAMVATPSLATDHIMHMVGDDAGWKVGFNYTAWAQGKTFHVGDTLIFMYREGLHNVLKVTGPDFQQCVASNSSDALTSGKDVVTLAKSGKNCGFGDHCSKGMKLVINVLEAEAPAPAPIPTPTPRGGSRVLVQHGRKLTGQWSKTLTGPRSKI
ncbi:Cupredoxin superfamily protein [Abeliophyllum distichum]|uniref:Cupredoxin superfamily protein n=1 Tax=Abeliophyllum distichum TaxID=126358 RepID=A0ABD1TW56_9LAMI